MASALAIVQKRFPSVTRVTDAMKSLFLDVSKQDSTSSNPKDHQNCALGDLVQPFVDSAAKKAQA